MTTADLLFSEQETFNGYPYSTCEHSDIWPSNRAFESFVTDHSLEFSACPSWIPNLRNPRGGNRELDSDWAVCLPATSNEIDARSFNNQTSHQLSHSDTLLALDWQQPTLHYPAFPSEAALAGVEQNLLPLLFQSTTPSECRLVQDQTAHSPGKRVSASSSPARSMLPRSMRHTPYPSNVRRGISHASVYECQWSKGGAPCGAPVTGTKNAIGRHLQEEHAICLRADKTDMACLWDECRMSMRRESIARHILAVHMRDKVICPTCGSRFARTDSLQRHRRTQCLVVEKTTDVCKVGE